MILYIEDDACSCLMLDAPRAILSFDVTSKDLKWIGVGTHTEAVPKWRQPSSTHTTKCKTFVHAFLKCTIAETRARNLWNLKLSMIRQTPRCRPRYRDPTWVTKKNKKGAFMVWRKEITDLYNLWAVVAFFNFQICQNIILQWHCINICRTEQ